MRPDDRQPRILLLRALGLGDFLTGVPAYRAVRKAFPQHRIVLAAPGQWTGLARLTGAVDLLLPTGELEPPVWPYAAPDLAVDLHGKGPLSHRLLTALRPRRLIAFEERTAEPPAVPWFAAEHEVHRWCRLLEASGVPADPDDLDLAVPDEVAVSGAPPLGAAAADRPAPVLIHPGAAAVSRRWPAERFAAVAARLREAGHHVLITGSPAERSLACEIARYAGLGPRAVLAGGTGPVGLAALVSRCAMLVCGDTGIAHLATAYRRPSVVLFGPVPPSEWGPPSDRPWHVALCKAAPGYRGDPHGAITDPALAAISVDEVLAACAAVAPHASRAPAN